MREFTENLTIAVGNTESNAVDLGLNKLAGVHVVAVGGGTPGHITFQALVGGQVGGTGQDAPQWADIFITDTTDPPDPVNTGYSADRLRLNNPGALVAGIVVLFRSNVAAYVPAIIRLRHDAAPTGTATVIRLITYPHP